jgi:hypothetical protein
MSILLLVNAGLLIRSFLNLLHVDVGFEPRNALTFRATFLSAIPPSGINAVREQALVELAGLPGVRAAGMTSYIPLSGVSKRRALTVEGQPVLKLKDTPLINLIWASPGLFNALNMPLVSGRDFAWSDRNAHVAVVDASLAKRYWPGQNPIGRRIRLGPPRIRNLGTSLWAWPGKPESIHLPRVSRVQCLFRSLRLCGARRISL